MEADMSLALQDIISESWARHSPLERGRTIGPVTAAYQRRTLLVYACVFIFGTLPWLVGGSGFLKALGLGLWFPGAGFLASSGPWALLIVPAVWFLFALALFAWFGAGMVIAPVIVWLGAALLAGAVAGGDTWSGAPIAALGMLALFAGFVQMREIKGRAEAAGKRALRAQILQTSAARVLETAAPAADPMQRELSESDVRAVRYLLDRALQPADSFEGFDIVDQFQTASLRYQINNCGYALAEIQANYLPNFRGYFQTAQLNLIEKYLHPKVWTYWSWETSWGHLNFTNHDPVGKDNIMLTGWLALHTGMYMSATGDQRFLEKGALTFRKGKKTAYVHDARDLVQSVIRNYEAAPYCLYPCEPNWAYPICNYIGMTGLAAMDTVTGTTHADSLRDRWLKALDAEFTDESGSIVGLRSTLTGLRFPFPGGELGFVSYQKILEPGRAWRMWAIARAELDYVMGKTASGETRIKISGRGFDFGNYRSGFGGVYAAIMAVAREFGDNDLALAAWRGLEEDCGLTEENGVRRFAKMSNLSNISAVVGQVRRSGDFERAVLQGAPAQALKGPMLTGVSYPEVLVAKAISEDGSGLHIVLYPGAQMAKQRICFENLTPGVRYFLTGSRQATVIADSEGRVETELELTGRTELSLMPAAN
jgi:hypothetical protein